MATQKQINAVNALVGNGGNITQAMKEAKYSPNTYNTPQKLTESKGFKEIAEKSGLTDEFLTEALYEDIKAKPRKREKELRLAFQIKGNLKGDEAGGNTYNFNFLTVQQQQRIARRLQAGDTESAGEPNRLLDSDEPTV